LRTGVQCNPIFGQLAMSIENFFGLEGLDAVGKSTTREALRNRGYIVLKTPPDSFPLRREVYDTMNVNLRFVFYLAGVVLVSQQARKMANTEHVVCDRYILTTMAAHDAMGLSKPIMNMVTPLLRRIPIPENTFLLVADEDERIRRMTERGANKVDIANLKINSHIIEGYRKWSAELGHRLTEIDTTELAPAQVVECIESFVYSK